MSETNPDILPYDEIFEKDLKPYTATDKDGKEVLIQVKNPSNHQSNHQYEQTPSFFFNLGKVIREPDRCNPSTSNRPSSLQHAQEGRVLVYEKDNYLVDLGVPYITEPQNDRAIVIVKYPNEGEAFTLTYRIEFDTK